MNAFLSTLILLSSLTQTSSGVASQQGSYPRPATSASLTIPQQVVKPQAMARTVVTSGDSFVGDPFLPEQAQENVLVVPTPDLPPESLADLTEDLSVMCRIFDKSLPAGRGGADTMYGTYGEQGRAFHLATGQQSRETQGLYLDGYGALFFLHVGYPVVPTESQEQPQAKAAEPTDSVWSQTVKEMSGQPGDEPQPARNAPKYDPEKVENLKRTLIKTLAHSVNIRMRRPQDMVTLVVGALDDNRSWGLWGQVGRTGTSRSWGTLGQSGATSARATHNSAASVVVIRVTKADVDAFAKGQLTLAQFIEKVQIVSVPARPSAPPTGATAPTSATSR